MAHVLLSKHCVHRDGEPHAPTIATLDKIAETGSVHLLSRGPVAPELKSALEGTNIHPHGNLNRGRGHLVRHLAEHLELPTHEILVVATDRLDIAEAKAGNGTLLCLSGTDWAEDEPANHPGLEVKTLDELREVTSCLDRWSGGWFWSASTTGLDIRVLFDLSTMGGGHSRPEVAFKKQMQHLVKGGGPNLTALTAFLSRSLLAEGLSTSSHIFGLYPSSASDNEDGDPLSGVAHGIRTVTSRVRFAERGYPLLLRSEPTTPRHRGGSRSDPAPQLDTLQVDPKYRDSIRDREVYLLDDCTTYGLSFSVARCLLLAAGAAHVTTLAFGKFGDRTEIQDIRLQRNGDCFKPGPKPFALKGPLTLKTAGETRPHADFQNAFTTSIA